MPKINAQPQKEAAAEEKKELRDSSENTIQNEPADLYQIGSSIVRRNEPDDED